MDFDPRTYLYLWHVLVNEAGKLTYSVHQLQIIYGNKLPREQKESQYCLWMEGD